MTVKKESKGPIFTANPCWKGRIKTKGNRGHQTPGKEKGKHCQTDPVKKFYACSPKAYKDKDYLKWHNEFKQLNMGAKA